MLNSRTGNVRNRELEEEKVLVNQHFNTEATGNFLPVFVELTHQTASKVYMS